MRRSTTLRAMLSACSVTAALSLACALPAAPEPEPLPSPQPSAPAHLEEEAPPPRCAARPGAFAQHVTREAMGETWPLAVEEACLYCEPRSHPRIRDLALVYADVGGTVYAVNGIAASTYPEIEPIWAFAPGTEDDHQACLRIAKRRRGWREADCIRTRVPIGPFIQRGLALCER